MIVVPRKRRKEEKKVEGFAPDTATTSSWSVTASSDWIQFWVYTKRMLSTGNLKKKLGSKTKASGFLTLKFVSVKTSHVLHDITLSRMNATNSAFHDAFSCRRVDSKVIINKT